MKRKLAIFALSCLMVLVAARLVEAQGSTSWIYGTVTSEPTTVTFGIVVYTFDFNVESCSNASLTGNVTCLALSAPKNGDTLNCTGYFITDNSSGMPLNAFFATSINSNGSSSGTNTTDITGTFKQIWAGLAGIGNLLVTFTIQSIDLLSGIELSQLVGSLIVIGIIGSFFMFFSRKLPWYIDIVGFFIIIAVVSNLLSSI